MDGTWTENTALACGPNLSGHHNQAPRRFSMPVSLVICSFCQSSPPAHPSMRQKSTNLGMLQVAPSGVFERKTESAVVSCTRHCPAADCISKGALELGKKTGYRCWRLQICSNDSPKKPASFFSLPRCTSPGRRSNWQLLRQGEIHAAQ